MCVSPIIIDNPNYHNEQMRIFGKDVDSQKLCIPCGVCCDCIAVKQVYMIQRVQMEAQKNRLFFGTLTYSDEMLPRVITSTGYEIAFADIRDIQLMIKRLRNDSAFGFPFRFYLVSEFGSKRGRPHFHILYLVDKTYLPDYNSCLNAEKIIYDTTFRYWCRNYGSKRVPYYKPCCEYHTAWRRGKLYYNYDLHYVNPSLTPNAESEVAFYVLKYMLKPSNREIRLQQALHLNLSEDEYNDIWSLVRPQSIKSLGFGYNATMDKRNLVKDVDIQQYLRNCVLRTPENFPYPCYYQPYSGASFPLSRFYRSNPAIFSAVDAINFYYTHDEFLDSEVIRNAKEDVNKFLVRTELADSHSHDDEFTNL